QVCGENWCGHYRNARTSSPARGAPGNPLQWKRNHGACGPATGEARTFQSIGLDQCRALELRRLPPMAIISPAKFVWPAQGDNVQPISGRQRIPANHPSRTRIESPIQSEDLMKAPFLIGRLLFGGFFLYNGIHHLMKGRQMAPYAQSKGVPAPEF